MADRPEDVNSDSSTDERKQADEALMRLAAIVQSTGDAILSTTPAGLISSWNRAAERLYGYSADEIIGQSIKSLVPPARAQEPRIIRDRIMSGQQVNQFETERLRKDGSLVSVSLTVSPITDATGEVVGISSVSRDITGRKRVEEELQHRANQFAALYDTSRDLATQQDVSTLLEKIIEHAMKLLDAPAGGIFLYDAAQNDLELILLRGGPAATGTRLALGEGLAGRVAQSRQPMILDDYQEWEHRSSKFAGLPTTAIIEVPMLYGGELIGVLGVHELVKARKFTEADARLLSLFAAQAASAVRNARLIEETRARAEQLTESESRLRTILESEPECVMLVAADGIILDINPAGMAMIEAGSLEQIVGLSVYELLPPEHRQTFRGLNEAVFRGEARSAEFEIIGLKGTRRWMESHACPLRNAEGAIVAQLAVTRDTSEGKRAQEALRESEERYRRFFEEDLAGDYISTPDGKLLACNPAFARMFGFASVEEAMTANTISFYPDPEAREAYLNLLRDQRRLEYFEAELRRKDGTPLHTIENAVGVFNERGDLVEIRGYVIDDTRRRGAEERLRQSQKLEAIGRLAGGVAHDFNNLMTAIIGYSELLLSKVQSSDPIRPDVEEIMRAGKRAASLTSQLLAFSRKQILQPKIVDLNETVANLERMLVRLIGEGIDLVTTLDQTISSVKVDPGQIEQVIVNLVVNARDAMPQGGKLTIETAAVYLDQEYARSHVAVEPGPYVMLAVSDTGSGMDAETLSHIFEPFFTTKEIGRGTGLGLSTVYGIVRQSGGNIWVYSQPGQGTTFKVYLPSIKESPDVEARAEPQGNVGGSETVLVAEDETAVRALMVKVLREHGYKALEASNGEEALQIAQGLEGEKIELLITDVVMPRMSGKDLADQFRRLFPEVKVLFISGYADHAIVRQGVLEEDTPFVQKPFTTYTLLRKVRELLNG